MPNSLNVGNLILSFTVPFSIGYHMAPTENIFHKASVGFGVGAIGTMSYLLGETISDIFTQNETMKTVIAGSVVTATTYGMAALLDVSNDVKKQTDIYKVKNQTPTNTQPITLHLNENREEIEAADNEFIFKPATISGLVL